MTECFLRLTRKWPEGAAVAALRNIDAVSHKKHRSACRRINHRLLKFKTLSHRLLKFKTLSQRKFPRPIAFLPFHAGNADFKQQHRRQRHHNLTDYIRRRQQRPDHKTQ